MLPGAAVVAGLVAGWLMGGRIGRLGELGIRWPALGVAGLVVTAGVGFPGVRDLPVDLRQAVFGLGYAAVAACVMGNLRLWPRSVAIGIALIAGGFALNAVVITANRGMPVSGHALSALGADPLRLVAARGDVEHVLAGPSTDLSWLGDVARVPPTHEIASAGDLLMAAGIAITVAAGTLETRQRVHA